ncbi:hypothetical protein LZC95_48770 [Pendulispora brunnea]|uniref:Uncharacterized protein n=1 Tax=Pendulispora brunnea TaxID=2905690 RepID=A0ABZ2KAD4_9BACT
MEWTLAELTEEIANDPWFARLIGGEPMNEQMRAEYQAWLRARGDVRAEVLRLHEALCAEPPPAHHAALREQFESLLGQVAPRWWRLVRTFYGVRNCGASPFTPEYRKLRFAYPCSKTWDTLEPTAMPKERHCQECGHSVYFCTSAEEASQRARQGQCISVTTLMAQRMGQRAMQNHTGFPKPDECWADTIFSSEEG